MQQKNEKKKYEETCCINHVGNSGAMETDGVVEVFLNSDDMYNLKYTTYVGDAESSSLGCVSETTKKYGSDYSVKKEDCIYHVHKRMGTAMRKYNNNCKGTKLSDGKTVGGAGRLTDAVIDNGYAIRNNKINTKNTTNDIWATYYHMTCGPKKETLEEQHGFGPKGQSAT